MEVGTNIFSISDRTLEEADKVILLLVQLRDNFSKDMLIDPDKQDFDMYLYAMACNQRCNTIMQGTFAMMKEITHSLKEYKMLKDEIPHFQALQKEIQMTLEISASDLHSRLQTLETDSKKVKKNQKECYNIGVLVQRKMLLLIDMYLKEFIERNK